MSDRVKPMFPNHRWSGWPGAICLYCGEEDILEVCLGECSWADDEGPIDCGHMATVCPATWEEKMAMDARMNPA